MLSVIMLNVTYKPSVLNVVMLGVVRPNVVVLSVMAPSPEHELERKKVFLRF
jgi:hypothetical protein